MCSTSFGYLIKGRRGSPRNVVSNTNYIQFRVYCAAPSGFVSTKAAKVELPKSSDTLAYMLTPAVLSGPEQPERDTRAGRARGLRQTQRAIQLWLWSTSPSLASPVATAPPPPVATRQSPARASLPNNPPVTTRVTTSDVRQAIQLLHPGLKLHQEYRISSAKTKLRGLIIQLYCNPGD